MSFQDAGRLPPGLDRVSDASGLQRLAQNRPPQRPTYLHEAVKDMQLTPQEQYLYGIHLQNLQETNGGIPSQEQPGYKHSLLQIGWPAPDGRTYNIPSVWDGRLHTEDEAIDHAIEIGLEKFPSYASQEEAEARYGQMHGYMERDMNEWAR
jgi:hypothetical protein